MGKVRVGALLLLYGLPGLFAWVLLYGTLNC